MRNSRALKAEARITVQSSKDLDRTAGGRVSEACIAGFHPAGAHPLRSGCALLATPNSMIGRHRSAFTSYKARPLKYGSDD